jgi:hypothetical protein
MNPRWRVLDFPDEARKGKMELLMAIGKIFGLATAAALGASLLIGQASAAPTNGLSAASQVTNNFPGYSMGVRSLSSLSMLVGRSLLRV